jgi:Secretion system C-terminal sorting domain
LDYLTTSIKANKLSTPFSIYPNPASTNITINASTVLNKVVVTDVLGKIVLTQTSANTSVSVDLYHLQTGVYFVTTNGVTKKIIKE